MFMKPFKLIISLLLLVNCTIAFAQVNNIYLGPEGGPGLGILWGNNIIDGNRKPAIAGTAGYAFQYNFTKIIALRASVTYQRAGTDQSVEYTDINGNNLGTSTVHNKFDYMTLPLLARATFGKKVNFFVDAGPYFGVLIKEETVTVTPVGKYSNNITGNFKRFDTGIAEGLGILIPFGGSFAVSFEARDNTGLYNINKPQTYYGVPAVSPNILRTNTTNFIFAFIYKLVTVKKAATPKKA